jgi:hypothetical protein
MEFAGAAQLALRLFGTAVSGAERDLQIITCSERARMTAVSHELPSKGVLAWSAIPPNPDTRRCVSQLGSVPVSEMKEADN